MISEMHAHNYILPISCVLYKFLKLPGALRQLGKISAASGSNQPWLTSHSQLAHHLRPEALYKALTFSDKTLCFEAETQVRRTYRARKEPRRAENPSEKIRYGATLDKGTHGSFK